MSLDSWMPMPWELRASRVGRVEPVGRSSVAEPAGPVRGDESRPWSRPSIASLHAGDVARFEHLVGFRGRGAGPTPEEEALGQAMPRPWVGSVPDGGTPAERIALGLAHLRSLRGL